MNSASVRGRFAPSPTGSLHLGNLRTALLAWLFARAAGGAFVLRVEDLDGPRNRPVASAEMQADLRWLGLDWDEGADSGGPFGPYVQSQRQAIYEAALARLCQADLIYPCYCSRADLSRIASAPHGEEAPRYPGTCATLSATQRRTREAAGRRPSWRFRSPDRVIAFDDVVVGHVSYNVAQSVGDFVVRRSDGVIAYQLAVVVDDALMGITQVVRGADLLSSTSRQLLLYDALGYTRPTVYAHVPLALDASGARLAKRDAASGITALRERGTNPAALLTELSASCGLWPADQPATLAQLVEQFHPALLRA